MFSNNIYLFYCFQMSLNLDYWNLIEKVILSIKNILQMQQMSGLSHLFVISFLAAKEQ